MTNPIYRTPAWRNLCRKRRRQAELNDEPCCRCGQPIDYALRGNRQPQAATIDHLHPIALGGDELPGLDALGVAHAICNSRHGGRVGRAIQTAKKAQQGGTAARTGAPRQSVAPPTVRAVTGADRGSGFFEGAGGTRLRGATGLLPTVTVGGGVVVSSASDADGSPRFMSGPHPRAAGTLADEWLPWIESPHGAGVTLRPWQRLVLQRAWEVDRDGHLCWPVVVTSTARQCLDGDTVVFRRDGSACRLRDHEDSWSTGVKPTRRVTLRGGGSVVATANHPVMTDRGWVLAGDLHVGDRVATLVDWPLDVASPAGVTDDHARFLGYMVTDGTGTWRTGSPGQSPKFTNTRAEYLDEVELLARDLFGICAKRYAKGNGFDLLLTGTRGNARNPVDLWLSGQGMDVAFPTAVFKWSRQHVGLFLNRAWAGNGSVMVKRRRGQVQGDVFLAVGNSESAARYWQMLLARHGVAATAKPERMAKGTATFWRLCVNQAAANVEAFFDLVGPVKGKGSVATTGNRRLSRPVDRIGTDGERIRFQSVVRIDDVGDREVFDLAVPGKGWFVANCVQVHNSGKSWLARAAITARCEHGPGLWGEPQECLHVANALVAARRIHSQSWRWAESRSLDVRRAFGSERLIWPNDSHWSLVATKSVWGASGSMVFVDEAWDIEAEVIEQGVVPTMLERVNPQLWLSSTANDEATDLMVEYRREALAGSDRVMIAEWSVPADVDEKDPRVWQRWAAHWSNQRGLFMAAAASKPSFARQYLNRWPDSGPGGAAAGWPVGWARCPRVSGLPPTGGVAAVESTVDRAHYGTAYAVESGGSVSVWTARHSSLEAAVAWVSARAPGRVVAGLSLVQLVVVPWPVEGFGSSHTMLATPLLADMVRRGLVAHDHGEVAAAQAMHARTVTGERGMYLSGKESRGPVETLKAASWAVLAALQPAPAVAAIW